LPLVARARGHGDRPAIIAREGTFSYRDLVDASASVAQCLLAGRSDLAEARVAFLAPPSFHYVATQWGIWRAGGIAVPLAVSHPPAELAHVIRDSEAETVVVHPDFAAVMQAVHLPPATRTVTTDEAVGTAPRSPLPVVAEQRRAMMVYTSGTAGKPKGVEIEHRAVVNFLWSMRTKPGMTKEDVLLAITTLSFEWPRADGSHRAAVGAATDKISRIIRSLGFAESRNMLAITALSARQERQESTQIFICDSRVNEHCQTLSLLHRRSDNSHQRADICHSL